MAAISDSALIVADRVQQVVPRFTHSGSRAARTTAELDIVIPALNEESRIAPTVRAICEALVEADFSSRLIVVDNGSVDATLAQVDAARPTVPVEVISCARKGKGAAVRSGVLHSRAPYVAYVDADLSTPPENLLPGFALLAGGADAVIGSRRVAGAGYEVKQSVVRRLGSRAFNVVAGPVVGDMPDTQCGFKMLAGDLARAVFAQMQVAGFAFDVELIARVRATGARMVELPVKWSNDGASTLNVVTDGIRAFADLAAVKRILEKNPTHYSVKAGS